jgi:hypothetical protein
VHDNEVLSYTVDCANHTVTLRTSFGSDPAEFTDVIFRGVAAYELRDDCFGNILLDIDEVEPARVILGASEKFESGRRYGWPAPWNSSLEDAVAFAVEQGLRGFSVCASLGLNGWVLARGMSVTEGSPRGAAD